LCFQEAFDVNVLRLVQAAAPAGGATAKKEEKEKPKEEEADVDMGGLFGDEYWALLLVNSSQAKEAVMVSFSIISLYNPLFYLLNI